MGREVKRVADAKKKEEAEDVVFVLQSLHFASLFDKTLLPPSTSFKVKLGTDMH